VLPQQIGNRAFTEIVGAAARQAKAQESSRQDPREREADAVADRVVGERAEASCAACDAGLPCTEPRSSGHSSVVSGALGSGRPLPSKTRALMESRFGDDFGDVRIHTDALAARSAAALSAHAYTIGRDVVIGGGMYAPGTRAGDRLLAHELTHVVQQRGEPESLQRKPSGTASEAWQPRPEPAGGDCAAISGDAYELQPRGLTTVLAETRPDPERWFRRLEPERRGALTAVYNRLCRFGLWEHVLAVVDVIAGEPPLEILGAAFDVPGATPSVRFTSRGADALFDSLMRNPRFCRATGAGASQHPGQATFREVSSSDSLHVSIGPGDSFDAHIDRNSPVSQPGPVCSNAPTPEALRHIGRELIPPLVRGLHGPAGVEVFPEQLAKPGVLPEDTGPPLIVGVTARGPRRAEEKAPPKAAEAEEPATLDPKVAEQIAKAVAAQVGPDALASAKARSGQDSGDPVGSYADPGEVALSLARHLDWAQRQGIGAVELVLGPQYAKVPDSDVAAIAAEIGRIARIVRALLPGQAARVSALRVFFGARGERVRNLKLE
jgi:hypothetical protein